MDRMILDTWSSILRIINHRHNSATWQMTFFFFFKLERMNHKQQSQKHFQHMALLITYNFYSIAVVLKQSQKEDGP